MHRRRHQTLLAICAVPLLLVPACSSDNGGTPATDEEALSGFPSGTFARDPAGVFQFSPDGLYLYWQQDQGSDLTAGGRWAAEETITFGPVASIETCEQEGTYRWSLDGDSLSFEATEDPDPCRQRNDRLDNQTYSREDTPPVDVGGFPSGVFVHADGPDRGTFTFTTDGIWLHAPAADAPPDVAGAFTVDGDTFTETLNTQSAVRDEGRQVPASYTWVFDGTTLEFALIGTDDSNDRREAYDGQAYEITDVPSDTSP